MLTKFDSRPYFVPNSLFIHTRWEKIIFLDNPTPPPFEKKPPVPWANPPQNKKLNKSLGRKSQAKPHWNEARLSVVNITTEPE